MISQRAGLALDRAALERALAELDGGGPQPALDAASGALSAGSHGSSAARIPRPNPPAERLDSRRVLSREKARMSGLFLKKWDRPPISKDAGRLVVRAGRRPVKRILIVEDSATMRSLLVSSLEELDMPVKVSEACSGFEALRCLPREDYDLVITDINMPDINGLELVSFVKGNAKYRSIPLIIVSTEGSERDRDKGLGLGADAYMVKPFEPEALREVAMGLLTSLGNRE